MSLRYAGAHAEIAEYCLNDNKKPPSRYDHSPKHNRYKCLICGEEIMTFVHAEKHGYESKDEMINMGLAVLISNKRGYREGKTHE
jgi:hypothetical protein